MKLSKLIENLQTIHKEYGDLDCTISSLEKFANRLRGRKWRQSCNK